MKASVRPPLAFHWAVVLLAWIGLTGEGSTQGIPKDATSGKPGVGATPGIAVTINPSANYAPRHRGAAGNYCIKITGAAVPFANNPNLYNHWIYAVNECPKNIKMQVCYSSSRSCIEMNVPGRERKEAILGTLPSIKDFKYEYREQF